MISNRLIIRLSLRILFIITIFIIIFNEFIVYTINKRNWSEIKCETDNCTKILLVADPQILGETSDNIILLNKLFMVDSDKYLQKTFEKALEFSKPNIICFLGDLLDEGSKATSDEYKSYVERFENIFYTNDNIKKIHIPGDNDIGGENGEYISNSNIRRFEIEFENNDIYDYKNKLRFFKINRLLLEYKNYDKLNNINKIRIGLTHLPLLLSGTTFLKNILNDINPHIIFSAHWHQSKINTYPTIISYDLLDNRVEFFDLNKLKYNQQYLEIMVPTSSYRMGSLKIGYGLAVIDNYNLRYTVLWSINRFSSLYLYLMWSITFIIVLIIIQITLRCSKRLTKKYINSYGRIYNPQFID